MLLRSGCRFTWSPQGPVMPSEHDARQLLASARGRGWSRRLRGRRNTTAGAQINRARAKRTETWVSLEAAFCGPFLRPVPIRCQLSVGPVGILRKIAPARNLVNFLAILPGISKPNRAKPPRLRPPGSRAFRHDWRRRSALPFPCALSKWQRGCSRCQGAAEYSSSTLCDP